VCRFQLPGYLLLDGDAEGIAARPQIQFLTDEEYEYTGGGLFVSFSHSEEIVQYKSSKNDLILNGIKISPTEFPIEADATLFFKFIYKLMAHFQLPNI